MMKRLMFWLIGYLSFTSYAANSAEIAAKDLLKANQADLVIVDVRTPEEYKQGHVPNAINLPLSNIVDNPSALTLPKDKTLVLYCRSGYRAGKATEVLEKNGFANLKHLSGDMLGWKTAGLPIEK